jgi:hypothetical protein
MGPAVAASKLIPAIVGGSKVAGPAQKVLPKPKAEVPAFTRDDIRDNVNTRLENAMVTWEAAIEGTFKEIFQIGRHPQHDWSTGVDNTKAGELMADFLADDLFWKTTFVAETVGTTVVCSPSFSCIVG